MKSIVEQYAKVFLTHIENVKSMKEREANELFKSAADGYMKKLRDAIAVRLGVAPDTVKIKCDDSDMELDDLSNPSSYSIAVNGLEIQGFCDEESKILPDIRKIRSTARDLMREKTKVCAYNTITEARAFASRTRLMHGEKLNDAQVGKKAKEWIAGACKC